MQMLSFEGTEFRDVINCHHSFVKLVYRKFYVVFIFMLSSSCFSTKYVHCISQVLQSDFICIGKNIQETEYVFFPLINRLFFSKSIIFPDLNIYKVCLFSVLYNSFPTLERLFKIAYQTFNRKSFINYISFQRTEDNQGFQIQYLTLDT